MRSPNYFATESIGRSACTPSIHCVRRRDDLFETLVVNTVHEV
jgi:hypothetical protein